MHDDTEPNSYSLGHLLSSLLFINDIVDPVEFSCSVRFYIDKTILY